MLEFLQVFVNDVKRNEREGIEPNYEYRITHRNGVYIADALDLFLEDAVLQARPGETVDTVAERADKYGIKKVLHNNAVYKTADHLRSTHDGWHVGFEIVDGDYIGLIFDHMGKRREMRGGFSSANGARQWARLRLAMIKDGMV